MLSFHNSKDWADRYHAASPQGDHHDPQVAAAVDVLRGLSLYKPPGVAETIDWATALGQLGATELDEKMVANTLGTVVKYREDTQRVQQHGVTDLVQQAIAAGRVHREAPGQLTIDHS